MNEPKNTEKKHKNHKGIVVQRTIEQIYKK